MVKKTEADQGKILSYFGFDEKILHSEPYGEGHIHSSYKITTSEHTLFLQNVNQSVFKNPVYLEHNIRLITSVLKVYYGPDEDRKSLLFFPLVNRGNHIHHIDDNGNTWRLSRFIEKSFSHQIVPDAITAEKASAAFADYILALSTCSKKSFYKTIHNFHNAALRLKQFESAVKKGILPDRIQEAKNEIAFCNSRAYLADQMTELMASKRLKNRIVHHDTKINNVLFDVNDGNPLCVVDLDTTMPGYILSDFGDMVRTMCNAAEEDEAALDKVIFRKDVFEGITKGFLNVLSEELNHGERQHLIFGAKLLIWMQAIRFLTDYLKGDTYYKVQYDKHNLVRTKNQIHLLKQIEKEETQLHKFVMDFS